MWKTEKLGELCEFQNGLWKGKKVPLTQAYVLRNTNFTSSGKLSFDNVAELKVESKQLEKRRLEYGDIILEKSGGGEKTPVGRVCIFEEKSEKTFSLSNFTSFIRIKNKNKLNSHFLHKFLFFLYIKGKTEAMQKHSTGIRNLQLAQYKDINIPLPSLVEQKRIVAKLDAAFTEIVKKTDNINQNIKNAEGLEVKFILKEIEKLDKSNLKKLSAVCDLTRGPFGGSLTKAMFVQKGFAIYEQKHAIRNNFETIKYFINEKKFNEMKRFELKAGDLLMSCSGTLGRVAIVPKNIKRGIINQALLKITPNKSIISKEYLKLIIISDYFQKILWNLSEGAAQVNVPSVKILKNILIPVPAIKKQEEIIKKISTLNNLRLENLYTQKKSLLESLKASILNNFLNINNKTA